MKKTIFLAACLVLSACGSTPDKPTADESLTKEKSVAADKNEQKSTGIKNQQSTDQQATQEDTAEQNSTSLAAQRPKALPKPMFSNDYQASYPVAAAQSGQVGVCLATYDITSEGLPENIVISHCSPANVFEDTCIEQITQLRYATDGATFQAITHKCQFQLK